MDLGSPLSLDFTFPFSSNTPQVSNGNGVGQGSPSNPGTMDSNIPVTSQTFDRHHRTSIDSMLDQEAGFQWPGSTPQQHQRQGSAYGVGNDPSNGAQDKNSIEDDRAPAWSELKTKAGKERKRLPLACIACRRKKIKCSGEKPACKHCLRARVPCVYKVTTRKAAPRTDYMGMLDKRLKRMEDRVIKMIPKDDLLDLGSTGRASVRPPLPGTVTKKEKAPTNKRSAEEAFTAELSEWTQARKPTNVLDKAARSRNQKEAENKLSTEGAEALPPRHLQEHLAELFFDCVYGQSYLLLHKPSFIRKLKAGTVPPVLVLAVCAVSARFSTHPQVNTEPAFLRGEQWATPARAIAEKRHFEPNITILTVMIILGLHYFGTCEGGLSWSFGGQASRMGYALQLHRELDLDPLGQAQAERAAAAGEDKPKLPELSFTDREIRRRLMWACYLMDTFNSSGTERPSFLNEEYLQIQLPIRESNFQMEIPGLTEDLEGHVSSQADTSVPADQLQAEAKANMGVGSYAVRAVVTWKRIVQYLNLGGREKDSYPLWDDISQFASLQRQISQLESSLPEGLTYTPENLATHVTKRLANQFLFLHIVIAQAKLFLHRFAIPTAPNAHRPYPPNTPKPFLASSATTVVEAAARISRILADSTGHTLTVPFAGYCAYASATVHVWGIFSRNAGLEAASKAHLRHNYRYLTRMKRYWGIFHYMAESVKDVYRVFAEATVQLRKARQQSAVTAKGDTKAAIDSIAMSADPSRDATPTPGADGQSSTQSDTPTDPMKSPARSKSGSGKAMFQYGDWFDRYPHGVSNTEWESSHLPHRNEAQKGTEAVMSQQSDLQSVEDFFASLSPPSKADSELLAGQRGRKVARKRGKSIAENTLSSNASTPASNASKVKDFQQRQAHNQSIPSALGTQKQMQSQSQHHHHSAPSLAGTTPELDPNTPDIDIPMSEFPPSQQQPLQSQVGSTFDMTSSPSIYQASQPFNRTTPISHPGSYAFSVDSPATASNAGSISAPGGLTDISNPQTNFNFNYTSALPHLDRQMVFGAYAGIDPSNSQNSSALNNPNNLDFWNNPWETDMDPLGGFTDPYAFTNPTSVPGAARKANSNTTVPNVSNLETLGMSNAPTIGGGNNAMSNTSAWFMPFNIEPPEYRIDDFNTAGFEGMDLSGGISTGNQGSDGSYQSHGGPPT